MIERTLISLQAPHRIRTSFTLISSLSSSWTPLLCIHAGFTMPTPLAMSPPFSSFRVLPLLSLSPLLLSLCLFCRALYPRRRRRRLSLSFSRAHLLPYTFHTRWNRSPTLLLNTFPRYLTDLSHHVRFNLVPRLRSASEIESNMEIPKCDLLNLKRVGALRRTSA